MVEITVKKTDFFTLTITMRIVATHTKGYIFAVGELLITEGCGNIFIAYHVYAERQHRRGTVFVCVPSIQQGYVIRNFGTFIGVPHDLGLSYDSREIDILLNYYYRHIHSNNSSKIGSRNVEMALHSILRRLW